jgi:hypothetical protein
MTQCVNSFMILLVYNPYRNNKFFVSRVREMKTESIRARLNDAKILKQECRILSAELQRQVSVSELISEMMEGIESAKKRVKEKAK